MRFRRQAKLDLAAEVRYYRGEGGTAVARRVRPAIQKACRQLESNPSIGSPSLGQELDILGLRTWLVPGFPLALWYFDRPDHVDVVRVVGVRQDAEGIELYETRPPL